MLNTNEARIETCTFCNYSCIFCPHNTAFTRKKEVMEYSLFENILKKLKKEAPQISTITLSGFGEAFIDPSIMRKITLCKNMNYKVHVLTNGSLLNKKIIDELFELEIVDIRISLHSLDPVIYKKLTNANHVKFLRVIDNINYIIENKNKTKIVLTFEIMDGINDNEVNSIIENFSRRVDLLEIWTPHNWVDAFEFRKGRTIIPTCRRPWNGPLQIQVDGTINMCCFDYNGKLLLGDFTKNSLDEIFNGQYFKTLKRLHKKGHLEMSIFICKNCDQRKDQSTAIIYNSKFKKEDRLYRTSTNYRKV